MHSNITSIHSRKLPEYPKIKELIYKLKLHTLNVFFQIPQSIHASMHISKLLANIFYKLRKAISQNQFM